MPVGWVPVGAKCLFVESRAIFAVPFEFVTILLVPKAFVLRDFHGSAFDLLHPPLVATTFKILRQKYLEYVRREAWAEHA